MEEIRKQADDVLHSSVVSPFTSIPSMSNSLETKRIYLYFQARSYTMSMPYRVQQIEEFVKQLESGDLKLRVRVMEVNELSFSLKTSV